MKRKLATKLPPTLGAKCKHGQQQQAHRCHQLPGNAPLGPYHRCRNLALDTARQYLREATPMASHHCWNIGPRCRLGRLRWRLLASLMASLHLLDSHGDSHHSSSSTGCLHFHGYQQGVWSSCTK